MTICIFCKIDFSKNYNFIRHLKENRCSGVKEMNQYEFYTQIDNLKTKIKELEKKLINSGSTNTVNFNNSTVTINSNTNINVNIEIHPVTKLALDHISPEKMKEVIEKYNLDKSKLNYLLTDYLNNVLCDSQHPENHAVKYIKRYPPTFNSITEDSDGNIITVIKGLNDSCELLSDPVLDVLKKKLHECIIKYREGEDYDYSLYDNAIKELKKELRKDKIKKVLSNFLKNDLINNIEMKLKINYEKN